VVRVSFPSLSPFCDLFFWEGIGELPATKLYEEVFPEVVGTLTDPPIPYHRGSPYGGKGWDTSDPTIGDVHQWNVWGGKELPYQEYDKLGGRFVRYRFIFPSYVFINAWVVSEFGIPSLPDMRTIAYWMDGADKKEWHTQSKIMAQHTRAGAFERRFAIVMNKNFRVTEDLET
jgi:beta-mannosidase